HQLGQGQVRVINVGDAAVDHLSQVVGGNVGGHTYRNAVGTVHQQVGEPAGQNTGLLLGLVKVGVPVNGLLVNVGEHVAGHPAHPGFGVPVGSGGVSVHAAEVALAVYQGIPETEILGQTDHGIIDRGITVG